MVIFKGKKYVGQPVKLLIITDIHCLTSKLILVYCHIYYDFL